LAMFFIDTGGARVSVLRATSKWECQNQNWNQKEGLGKPGLDEPEVGHTRSR
jgi:hypothetical protein